MTNGLNKTSRLKGYGYLTSIVSVLLLGAVAWDSASEKPLLLTLLILGMLTSMGGMALRWRAQIESQRETEKLKKRAAPASGGAAQRGSNEVSDARRQDAPVIPLRGRR